jgi:CheY-like chemotaxis protein
VNVTHLLRDLLVNANGLNPDCANPAEPATPGASRAPALAAAMPADRPVGAGKPAVRILVVDDDPLIAGGAARLLARNGYETVQANSGGQALILARQQPPDLVLLDVMLPDIGGLDVCRRLKADPSTGTAFVVLCSALRNDSCAVVAGVDAGCDGYLARPIENRELLARVEAFLRHKATIDALRSSERYWREQFERERQASYDAEIRALGESAAGTLPVSSRLLGAGPLSETAPLAFAELEAAYGRLLADALEQRMFRIGDVTASAVRDLVAGLVRLRAGARDAADLHYRVLSALSSGETPKRAQALMETGRLTLLEIMGRLLNAYRSQHIGACARQDGQFPATSNGGRPQATASEQPNFPR